MVSPSNGISAACAALVLCGSSCSVDRTPEFRWTRDERLLASVPNRSVDDELNESFGETPVPVGSELPAADGRQCGGVFCPSMNAPAQACCTTTADVARGAARQAARCGASFGGASSAFQDACWQRDQPGLIDDRCPSRLVAPSFDEAGCCTEQGKCGGMNVSQSLGCHYALDAEPEPCGMDDIDDGVECEGPGIFGARIVAEATWGVSSGGLLGLADHGRDQITFLFKIVLDAVDAQGEVRGTMLQCGRDAPPFYTTLLCEAFHPVIAADAWQSPDLPEVDVTGRYQCLHPGCLLTLDPLMYSLGIELDPSAPWPTAEQTPTLRCPSGTGVDCFPDHDSDGLPGITASLITGGPAEPRSGCDGTYALKGAPLSADPAVIFDAVRRADRILVGSRSKSGGSVQLAPDCQSGIGAGIAELVQTRTWGCVAEEGTANPGMSAAGPNDPCTAEEALFLDQNMPTITLLQAGEKPDPELNVDDRSASTGPRLGIVRLGDVDDEVTCADVREAVYP